MGRRLLIADVLLAAGVLLLAIASVHRITAAAADRHRVAVARRAFTAYVAGTPGHFVRLEVTPAGALDLACARHRAKPWVPADFKLCARVRHQAGRARVTVAYATGLTGPQRDVRHRCAGDLLARARCRPATGPFASGVGISARVAP
jgi:hypothetical protein